MYALIVPASTPLVLLAILMALSWWEDRILPSPPAEPTAAPAEAPVTPLTPLTPATAAQHLEVTGLDTPLTGEVAGP